VSSFSLNLIQLLLIAGAFGLGFGLAYFMLRSKILVLKERGHFLEKQLLDQQKIFEQAKKTLEDSFRSLSSEALRNNNQSFLTLAKTQLERFQEIAKNDLNQKQDKIYEMVRPVKESLEKVDSKLQQIEKTRVQSEAGLKEQIQVLNETNRQLRTETSSLVAALRSPQTRGQWGEMQLKRVVEMAGMLDHCDFRTQQTQGSVENRLRPDLVVKLPGGKNIIVDAKTPLNSYLEAVQSEDISKKTLKFKDHARHVRKHIDDLGKKSYWDQFQPSPEFVILFLPGEAFFSAALEQDPSLIEAGVAQNVIVATPTTLIALLRAAAYGWQQESLANNVKLIGNLGKELYKRLADMGKHLTSLGKNLNQAVDAYNRSVGSIESRVLVSARRMQDLSIGSSKEALPELPQINQVTKELSAPEFSEQ